MNYRVLVTTCDKYVWITRIFAELFNKHWGSGCSVDVLCETKPTFELPGNFNVISVGEWPRDKWSNVVRNHIQRYKEKNVVLLLEDYLFTRDVDVNGVEILSEYMTNNKDILRIDLTADRLHSRGDSRAVDDVCTIKHYDIIEASDTSYQMSLQAGIFNIELLSIILRDDINPWQVELESQYLIDNYRMRVFGTRQVPIKYINALGTGTPEGCINIKGIHPQTIERALQYHWIPEEYNLR